MVATCKMVAAAVKVEQIRSLKFFNDAIQRAIRERSKIEAKGGDGEDRPTAHSKPRQ